MVVVVGQPIGGSVLQQGTTVGQSSVILEPWQLEFSHSGGEGYGVLTHHLPSVIG